MDHSKRLQLPQCLPTYGLKLKGITQTLHKNQERLTKLETPLENRNKHEEKHGPLTTYQNN